MHMGPIPGADVDQVRATIDLNLVGTFLCIKHAAPHMAAGVGPDVGDGPAEGGSIIGMSSGAGHFPHRYLWAYGAAKAGIDMLCRYAAEELGSSGVRVNTVRPGIIDDELMAPITAGGPLLDDYLAEMPIRRLGTVEDVADAVRFLAGPESALDHGRVPGRRRRSPPAAGRQLRPPLRGLIGRTLGVGPPRAAGPAASRGARWPSGAWAPPRRGSADPVTRSAGDLPPARLPCSSPPPAWPTLGGAAEGRTGDAGRWHADCPRRDRRASRGDGLGAPGDESVAAGDPAGSRGEVSPPGQAHPVPAVAQPHDDHVSDGAERAGGDSPSDALPRHRPKAGVGVGGRHGRRPGHRLRRQSPLSHPPHACAPSPPHFRGRGGRDVCHLPERLGAGADRRLRDHGPRQHLAGRFRGVADRHLLEPGGHRGGAGLHRPGVLPSVLSEHQANAMAVMGTFVLVFVIRIAAAIMEKKEKAEASMRMSEDRFRSLIQNSSDTTLVMGTGGICTYASPAVSDLTGYTPDEVLGRHPLDYVHPDDRDRVRDYLGRRLQPARSTASVQFRMMRKDGSWCDAEAVVANQLDRPSVAGYVINIRDITERKEFEALLAHRALHDPLTGLPNRQLLLDRAEQMLARARREIQPVAAFFIDLDNFKDANDSLGHEAGDRLLQAVAARFVTMLRASDTIGRMEGTSSSYWPRVSRWRPARRWWPSGSGRCCASRSRSKASKDPHHRHRQHRDRHR